MLIDSNLVIYAALPEHGKLRRFIYEAEPSVSAITYVEVLGYHSLTDRQRRGFENFFVKSPILPLDEEVLERATQLRQLKRIKLGDSLVAATALQHNLSLATHNVADFQWIEELDVLDPLR
jgi:predicted nucleic acid-binding protein